MRITVNTPEAARQVAAIREPLAHRGCDVPLVGDFHYNGHRLLTQFPDCAEALDKYRINPGNVGYGAKRDEQFATLIEIACRHGKSVRIGVNWGSLDQDLLARMMDDNARLPEPLDASAVMREALIVSAVSSARRAEALGLPRDRIVLSCKVSGVQDLIAVYRSLAVRCDYPLHLGLTEAGMGSKGIVASTAALAVLLQEGIGDTIRISLTPEPGGDRTREVRGGAGNPADDGAALVHADGGCVPRVRAHYEHVLPGARRQDSGLPAPADAGLARPVSRGRDHDRGRDGVHRERPWGEQARQHRHQPARYRGAARPRPFSWTG